VLLKRQLLLKKQFHLQVNVNTQLQPDTRLLKKQLLLRKQLHLQIQTNRQPQLHYYYHYCHLKCLSPFCRETTLLQGITTITTTLLLLPPLLLSLHYYHHHYYHCYSHYH
jgi:hypothetical protein